MKVIIIKPCKDGNVNDIIEVADGYAKNFLIRKGFAVPINHATQYAHDKKNEEIAHNIQLKKENALKAKRIIEDLVIKFSLKTTNNVVHGSITRKQVLQKLKSKKVSIDSHAIENVHINSIGITNIKVKISKGVEANLKVEVVDANKK